MYKIKTMNHISPCGLQKLEERGCVVGENIPDPDGLILRSANLHSYAFEPSLIAIARSGAGTNNIPLEDCCHRGIVVFNSPGANAEAVKEQILCSLVLSSRDVLGSIDWVKSLNGRGKDIPALVEKGKSQFAGPELMGKTLGVIGLGAIGALIANAAVSLGMNVCGYDPYLSVDAAWRLSRDVKHEVNLDGIYAKADYISINVPYTDTTYHMLDAKAFSKMKDGVRIIRDRGRRRHACRHCLRPRRQVCHGLPEREGRRCGEYHRAAASGRLHARERGKVRGYGRARAV